MGYDPVHDALHYGILALRGDKKAWGRYKKKQRLENEDIKNLKARQKSRDNQRGLKADDEDETFESSEVTEQLPRYHSKSKRTVDSSCIPPLKLSQPPSYHTKDARSPAQDIRANVPQQASQQQSRATVTRQNSESSDRSKERKAMQALLKGAASRKQPHTASPEATQLIATREALVGDMQRTYLEGVSMPEGHATNKGPRRYQ